MNLLMHMSVVAVLDFLFFRFWYSWGNRYTVLNFHETGFLPARYIISGLVAGTILYWFYLLQVLVLSRYVRNYRHPAPLPLWALTALITSIQIMQIVRSVSVPPLGLGVAVMLLIHLQAVHLLMFRVGAALRENPRRLLVPGVWPGVMMMGFWLFWIGYSFGSVASGSPRPIVGSPLERYSLMGILSLLMLIGVGFMLDVRIPWLARSDLIIPELKISVADIIRGFFAAWALFYLLIPPLHYLLRGYVTAHSNIFPAFLPGLLVVMLWSLVVMWPVILLMRPKIILRLPRPTFFER